MLARPFPTSDVLGVPCVIGDVDSAATGVLAQAMAGDGGYGVLCNVHVLMTAHRSPGVMDALQAAWAVFPDGAPIAWLQRRAGASNAARIGGPDLMPAVFDRGRVHGTRHALFGSTPEVVARVARNAKIAFPGINIVATHAPLFGRESDQAALDRLRDARADIVWCALGAPKQELWMARHAELLAPALVLGVGAAFDFQAAVKIRAPQCMQRAGLEWLHRLLSEPRRLASRYAKTNMSFIVAAAPVVLRRSRG
jgi:N-acetylglucosaminyldiphosphoundecaprenol N-acetyl-beta-D-mannosaminyltransferase